VSLNGRKNSIHIGSARTFEGNSVVDSCLRRAELMVTTLLRSLPAPSAGTATS
jgi:hypothetical protein